MRTKTTTSLLTGLIVFLGAIFCLTTTLRTSKVAASSDKQQIRSARNFSRAWQGPQAGQTVAQTRKNIQVLKDLPESQLYLVMNFVATSLGVNCNYCHVQQGKDPTTGTTKWVWESDDKPSKHTARRMMQMVLAVKANDKIDFRENEVTCFTCHQGQRKPIGLPPMPLARSGHEPEPEGVATPASTSVPSVDQIFSKYFDAVGGSAASKTETLVLKGKREASQNRSWPNEITIKTPDRVLMVAMPASGPVRQILNGDRGWSAAGTNVRALTPAEVLDAQRRGRELFYVVKAKPSPGMRVGGVQKLGERETYVVENVTDTKTERYFFDSQTGLLLRKITLNKTMLMPFPEQVDFEDYRDVDGVKMPFVIRYSAIDTYDSWNRTFTEIKRNVAVDDTSFVISSP